MDVLKKKLCGISGGRILDVATGRGSFVKTMMSSFRDWSEITAIDICDASKLQEIQKQFETGNISFAKMNAEKLIFDDNHFDTVAISNSLHHLNKLDAVLAEMLRVLKPGGIFIVNEMIRDGQSGPQLTHVLMHHWWADIDTKLGICHNETYKKQQIIDIINTLGLKDMEIMEHIEPVPDPKDPDDIQSMNKIIGEYCKKAEGLPDFQTLKLQGDQIRKRLNEAGIANATQVIIIGVKK